jgi:hypothetical protein
VRRLAQERQNSDNTQRSAQEDRLFQDDLPVSSNFSTLRDALFDHVESTDLV